MPEAQKMTNFVRYRGIKIECTNSSVGRKLQIRIQNDIGFGNQSASIVENTGSRGSIFEPLRKHRQVFRRCRDSYEADAISLGSGRTYVLVRRRNLAE